MRITLKQCFRSEENFSFNDDNFEKSERENSNVNNKRSDYIEFCRKRKESVFNLRSIRSIFRSISFQEEIHLDQGRSNMNWNEMEERDPILTSVQVTEKPIRTGNI